MTHSVLAETLRVLRARRGVGFVEAAEGMGVDRHTLRRLERGQGNPSYATLHKAAEYYGVTPQSLLVLVGEEGEAEPPKASAPTLPQPAVEAEEQRRISDVVHELVTRQIEEDWQAIARARESELAQGSTVRHENEARDRLLQYHPADVAELAVDLMRRVVHTEQELKRLQTGVSQPEATKAIEELTNIVQESYRAAAQRLGQGESVETGDQR